MTETKLRDVVAGAIADAGDPNDEALIIEILMRRLGKAMMIELDDGTVFVRRPSIRRPSWGAHTFDGRPCYMCGKVHTWDDVPRPN